MSDIEIQRPKMEEFEFINDFFKIVLVDTFERNGISDLVDTFNQEIATKRHFLEQDLESGGKDRYFLIAKQDDKIIGSIEYGQPNELIIACTNGELKDHKEIGTIFVHPKYQKKGIGTMLINAIVSELAKKNIQEFCLDSGYKSAQKIWIRKFGNPQYCLKDYWGQDADHMIWRIRVDE